MTHYFWHTLCLYRLYISNLTNLRFLHWNILLKQSSILTYENPACLLVDRQANGCHACVKLMFEPECDACVHTHCTTHTGCVYVHNWWRIVKCHHLTHDGWLVGWVRAHLTDHGVITRHVLCVRLFISGSQYAMALAFHLIDRFNVSHKNMTRCWKSVHCGVASRYSNVLICRQGPQEQPTVPTTHTHTHGVSPLSFILFCLNRCRAIFWSASKESLSANANDNIISRYAPPSFKNTWHFFPLNFTNAILNQTICKC